MSIFWLLFYLRILAQSQTSNFIVLPKNSPYVFYLPFYFFLHSCYLVPAPTVLSTALRFLLPTLSRTMCILQFLFTQLFKGVFIFAGQCSGVASWLSTFGSGILYRSEAICETPSFDPQCYQFPCLPAPFLAQLCKCRMLPQEQTTKAAVCLTCLLFHCGAWCIFKMDWFTYFEFELNELLSTLPPFVFNTVAGSRADKEFEDKTQV